MAIIWQKMCAQVSPCRGRYGAAYAAPLRLYALAAAQPRGLAMTPYDTDLDRNPANFQPLTPLSLLERAAAVFPDRPAIAHGPLRRSYREFHARTKKLASALARRGFGRGDTVAV